MSTKRRLSGTKKRNNPAASGSLGQLDPHSGEFIPSKRLRPEQAAVRDPAVTATTKIIGPALILDRITAELTLDTVLHSVSPPIPIGTYCAWPTLSPAGEAP